MRRLFSRLILTAGVMLLVGCGTNFDYESLRRQESVGKGFGAELARQYRTPALFEADEMFDWPDAALFGTKSLAAATGQQVMPERLTNWRLPTDKRAELREARTDLMRLLSGRTPQQFPSLAAKAQANFDCWVEQQEENWQWDHIAACRKAFRAALTALEGKRELPARVYAPAGLTQASKTVSESRSQRHRTAFTVFFAFDSADILEHGRSTIAEIAHGTPKGRKISIIVQGHADRAGPQPYNLALSLRRAARVRDELVAAGMAPESVTTTAHGELRPRVVTPDGIREFRNRRVEVILATGPAL